MRNIFEELKEISKYDGFDFEVWEENLFEFEGSVCNDLGIWLESSIQSGVGGITIYNSEDDEELSCIDNKEFIERVEDIALNSSDAEEFTIEFRRFLEEFI